MEVHSSWNDFYDKEEFESILALLNNQIFYPEKDKILRFMKNDLSKAKYVLFGLDPYIGTNEYGNIATGRCFEINGYNNWQQTTKNISITNILKAIYYQIYHEHADIETIRQKISEEHFIMEPSELFDSLEKQGMILTNYSLTVQKKAGDNIKIWHDYTERLIKFMMEYNDNIKFILWGKKVQERLEPIINDPTKWIEDYHPRCLKFVNDNTSLEKINGIYVCKRKLTH